MNSAGSHGLRLNEFTDYLTAIMPGMAVVACQKLKRQSGLPARDSPIMIGVLYL